MTSYNFYWLESNGRLFKKYSTRKDAVEDWKSIISDEKIKSETFDSQFRFVVTKNRKFYDRKRFLSKISTARRKGENK